MIERKYKIENNRLVRRSDGEPVPDDVPVFILLAQDINALPVLLGYNMICLNLEHKAGVVKSISDFTEFRNKYPDRMKEPDS